MVQSKSAYPSLSRVPSGHLVSNVQFAFGPCVVSSTLEAFDANHRIVSSPLRLHRVLHKVLQNALREVRHPGLPRAYISDDFGNLISAHISHEAMTVSLRQRLQRIAIGRP